ncbi:MAG: glycosyltransferase family 4 protein [Acidimicrobiales bacterium]
MTDDPLRVALDATPLIGQRTGVGEFCRGALGGLAARDDVSVSAFAVSWRRRRWGRGSLPAGVSWSDRPMPARPLHWSWGHSALPPAEWFVGDQAVVHGTNFVVPPTRRAGRVVTVHDLTAVHYPEMCSPATLHYPDLIRRALGTGAFVHTPSRFVADEVIEVFGADPDRVRAVHSGVPLRPPAASGTTAGVALPPGTDRFILSMATAEPRKDLPGLVAAFDQVAADRPDVALVLAGPAGWGADALAQAVTAARHRARIVLPGWIDDAEVDALIGSASLLAYPSRYEGFGLPPLEAMARGVPVVATSAGAIAEVLGDGASLVAVGDVGALVGALAEILDSEVSAARWADAGRRRAAQFSWDACAEGLVGLYRLAAGTASPNGVAR